MQGNCSIPWRKIGVWISWKRTRVEGLKWFVKARWDEKGRKVDVRLLGAGSGMSCVVLDDAGVSGVDGDQKSVPMDQSDVS